MSDYKPRVCVDFDGVLNDYTGWKGEEDLGLPSLGACEFLRSLADMGYEVVIFTTRHQYRVNSWLEDHGVVDCVSDVTSVKPPAKVYVDDRAVCHRGDFDATLEAVIGFKAHWEAR